MCNKCLMLLEKNFNFHKVVIQSENRIKSLLKHRSEYFKKHFKVINLIQRNEEENNQISGIDEESSSNSCVENLVTESETAQKTDSHQGTVDTVLKDCLLDALDTAILSCEDSIAHNKTRQTEILEQESSSERKSYKPYNTRNKRKKIIVETEYNDAADPDFLEPAESDTDSDYVEGSEELSWIPKHR